MADTPKHSVSVAGVVVDDQDRILVIQRRDNGHWEPPGGVLELAETPEEGVRREVWEETGVAVDPVRLTGVYKNMTRGIIALVFRCVPVEGYGIATEESKAVAWHSLPKIRDEMSESYYVRVSDAFTDGVDLRAHDGTRLLDIMR